MTLNEFAKEDTLKSEVAESVIALAKKWEGMFTGYDLLQKYFEKHDNIPDEKKAVIRTYVYEFLKSEYSRQFIEFVKTESSDQGDFSKNQFKWVGK